MSETIVAEQKICLYLKITLYIILNVWKETELLLWDKV
jgi:hypothetical protein